MKRQRRALIFSLGGAFLSRWSLSDAADSYPSRPIRLIVSWPPGSSADTGARILANRLEKILGQTIIVENRGGASGIIGSSFVAKAPPDGYTLLFTTSNHASNEVVYPNLPYDPIADFAPVSMVQRSILCIAVNPALPVRNLTQLIQYAKENPQKLSFGTPGLGTPHQLVGELLKQRAKINMIHVPYKGGGPAMTDVVSGHIPISINAAAAVLPFMRTGQVRVIAISDSVRFEDIPDVSTISETYPGLDVSGWSAIFAPAKTPTRIINQLNAAIAEALSSSSVKQSMATSGLVATPLTPDALTKRVMEDRLRWLSLAKSGVSFTE
jgi:tripartite-type tricarboxylate transporter receptor subunit TctC